MFHVVTRFPILLALNTNANTVIDATRVKGARYMCVVVTIEYSADNLRYKLRFVNGQMVHFTNFCLYGNLLDRNLCFEFPVSNLIMEIVWIFLAKNKFRFKNCNYFTIVLGKGKRKFNLFPLSWENIYINFSIAQELTRH